ncbi:MAG: 4'-phosphopantetheinyl transferase superfamily protein [Pseudomonadota bacterium]
MDVSATDLEKAFSAIAPPNAAVRVVQVDADAASPFAEEARHVARAQPKRRAEFFAGRQAARLALGDLGVDPIALPVGHRRMPLWPKGIVGAITHAGGFAAAITARSGYHGIGIDLERNGRVRPDLARFISSANERLKGPSDPGIKEGDACPLTLRFAGKEAGFKAYFPSTGHFLGFSGASCHAVSHDRFLITIEAQEAPGVAGRREIEGRYALLGAHLMALAWVSA